MMFRNNFRKSLSLKGERSTALEQMRGRIIIVAAFFVVAYSVMALRAFDLAVLQVIPQDQEQEYYASSTDELPRGDIVDRNGVLLATTLPSASLYADSSSIYRRQCSIMNFIYILPCQNKNLTGSC